MFGSLFDIVTYPVNLAVNAVKDVFSFGSEDASPFRLSDFFFGEDGVIPNAIKKITDMFAITEDFFADIDLGDMAKNFMRGLLQAILPPPDFLSFKLPEFDLGRLGTYGGQQVNLNPIPDGVYRFAGLNPETGEVDVQKSTQDVIDLGRAGLQDEFFKAQREKDVETMERLIREAREQRENNMTINQIYNQQDMSQKSSVNQFSSEGISDMGAPIGAFTSGPG